MSSWLELEIYVDDCVSIGLTESLGDAVCVTFSREFINEYSLDRLKLSFSYNVSCSDFEMDEKSEFKSLSLRGKKEANYQELSGESLVDYRALLEKKVPNCRSLASFSKVLLRNVIMNSKSALPELV